jgi:hypothetical protein
MTRAQPRNVGFCEPDRATFWRLACDQLVDASRSRGVPVIGPGSLARTVPAGSAAGVGRVDRDQPEHRVVEQAPTATAP